jgi:hypothetical protein
LLKLKLRLVLSILLDGRKLIELKIEATRMKEVREVEVEEKESIILV